MTELSNEMILSDLKIIGKSNTFFIILMAIIFIILFTILAVKFKKNKKERFFTIIITLLITIILGIPFYKDLLLSNAIKYSIKNSTWNVEIDTLEKITKKETHVFFKRTYTNYYAYLKNHGKISIPKKGYDNLPEDQKTYIITVQGMFGKTYTTNLIYPTNEFNYTK